MFRAEAFKVFFWTLVCHICLNTQPHYYNVNLNGPKTMLVRLNTKLSKFEKKKTL